MALQSEHIQYMESRLNIRIISNSNEIEAELEVRILVIVEVKSTNVGQNR